MRRNADRATPGRWLQAAIAALALAGAAETCARSLQQVLNTGTLRIGVVMGAPWVLRNGEGELDGFEIDVGERLAADLGVEPEFVVYRFDALIPAIEAGEVDVLAAGLTITPERALHVNFSRPYAVSGITLATNLRQTADVARFEELSDPAFRVGAVRATAGAELAAGTLPDAEIVLFNNPAEAAEALVNGRIHAYLDEEPGPTFLALEYPGLIDIPIARPLLETRSAFAVAKGDADFIAYLNAWIEAHEADTFLPATHRYWFESLRWRER